MLGYMNAEALRKTIEAEETGFREYENKGKVRLRHDKHPFMQDCLNLLSV